MMYCNKAGLISRFGEDEMITLTDNGQGEMDDAVIESALSDASDEIDTYLATRHDLPLETVPDLVVRLCADIARYRLHDSRMLDEVEKRYDDSIKLLKEIAKGSAVLPIQATSLSSDVEVVRDRQDRTFTRESLESF